MKMSVILVAFIFLAASLAGQGTERSSQESDTWTLRGRAVDELGKPIQGAGLLLFTKETTTEDVLTKPAVRTDEHGRFELTWTPRELGGIESLWIAAPGRVSAIVGPVGAWPGGQALEKRTYDVGDVVLPRGITLRGKVRKDRGKPLPGARVVARDVLQKFALENRPWGTNVGYFSAAKTDDNGAFALLGVFISGSFLEITADGFYRRELPYVTTRDPLVIEMTPGGVVEGLVTDSQGKPSKAHVSIQYEAGDRGVSENAGDDGRFRINLDYPGQYRLRIYPKTVGVMEEAARSQVLLGPTTGLEFRMKGPTTPKTGVLVRITEAATGKAVEDASAAVLWLDAVILDSLDYVERMLQSRAVQMRQPGEILLPGPKDDEPDSGIVMVKAKGYAPLTLKDVTWSEESPPKLEARLKRESILSGVVIDEATNKPVEGAFVVIGDQDDLGPWDMMIALQREATDRRVSDARGHFRVHGLAAGKHHIRAVRHGRPHSESLEVEVAEAKERGGLRLVLPSGSKLLGKVIGGKIGVGWTAELRKTEQRAGRFSSPTLDRLNARSSLIAKDGSFTIGGLSRGKYKLELTIPHRQGRGGMLEIPIEPLRLRKSDLRREFDISEDLPGLIRGKVTIRGAPFPLERLVVAAVKSGQRVRFGGFGSEKRYVHDMVSPDGSFAIPVVGGDHTIELIDAATGVVLGSKRGLKAKPSAAIDITLEIELAIVRVTVKHEKGAERVALARLEVVVQREKDDEAPIIVAEQGTRDTGVGVSLADGAREVTLFLPLVETKLRLRSFLTELLAKDGERALSVPLAEHEFTPKKGEINRVVILVPPPKKQDKP